MSYSLFQTIFFPSCLSFEGRSGSDTDDRLLCPVRAVRAYLSRVKAKRSGRKRLFLPLKGSIRYFTFHYFSLEL